MNIRQCCGGMKIALEDGTIHTTGDRFFITALQKPSWKLEKYYIDYCVFCGARLELEK